MKRLLFICMSVIPLYAAPVEWNDQESFPAPPPFYPFSLGGSYTNVAPAAFTTPGTTGKLHYVQYDANFSYTHPFSETHGLIFGTGWVGVDLNWANNPDFNETNFNYIDFSFGGFSKVFSNWVWTLNIAAFLDTQQFSFSDYALYQSVLWGKYTWNPCIELDFGFLLELGLNQDFVWPILGFIYNYNDRLRLHAVYPIDMTLEYDLMPTLTAAGAVRILRNRHRVADNEPLPQAVFLYQTWGLEFDLEYKPVPWFFVNGFVGSTTPGNLTISNRDNTSSTDFKFKSSFYAGLNSALSF
ncbi:MAG: hypothetical protein JSS62_01260 [Verrucomicrobia bacterium]|nr:hypothetical protein [Verrucomicrobiota bacterium]MBS0646097.1 hypothetical protein [Verrucomicrobiota bacterium]